MYKAKEFVVLIFGALILGFFLSLVFPGWNITLESFLLNSLLVFIMFFIFSGVQKLVALSFDCNTQINFMNMNRYWVRPHDTFGFDFPIWIILVLLTTFLTAGKFVWTGILNFNVTPLKTRVKHQFSEPNEEDIAKIASAGPLALMIFGLIMRIVGFNSYATLCVLTSFLLLLPFGNGSKMFAGMRNTGIFILVLALAVLVLMHLTTVIVTIIIALIIAMIAFIIYYKLAGK